MKTSARHAALDSLLRCDRDEKYSNLELDAAIARHGLEGREKALFTALLYGVIERRCTLDYIISLYSRKPLDKLDAAVLQILRLGIYQILFLNRIPDSAACNESVRLCKESGYTSAAPFVNAVLRQTVRQKDRIPYPDPQKDPLFYLEAFYAFPRRLAEIFTAHFGFARTCSLLEAYNRPAPLTLRVNTLRTTRDALMDELCRNGLHPHPTHLTDSGILLDGAVPVSALSCLTDGRCFVQDEASQYCARLLDARPGQFVIDCCACPGGKSFSLAMDMQNRGTLRAHDLHKSKLSAVQKGGEQLGISILSCHEQDGTVFCPELDKAADRVLCDVPCSGFGVIAKKPDLRHKDPASVIRLPHIQKAILQNGARYVKEGGYLVYSTCTVFAEENEAVIQDFLSSHAEFTPESMRTFYPDTDGTDGFFVAKLRRIRH